MRAKLQSHWLGLGALGEEGQRSGTDLSKGEGLASGISVR